MAHEDFEFLCPKNVLSSTSCDVCSSSGIENFCAECEQWMCSSCAHLHARFGGTRSHELTKAVERVRADFEGLKKTLRQSEQLKAKEKAHQEVENALQQLENIYNVCLQELSDEYVKKKREILERYPEFEKSRQALRDVSTEVANVRTLIGATGGSMEDKLEAARSTCEVVRPLMEEQISKIHIQQKIPEVEKNGKWSKEFVKFIEPIPLRKAFSRLVREI